MPSPSATHVGTGVPRGSFTVSTPVDDPQNPPTTLPATLPTDKNGTYVDEDGNKYVLVKKDEFRRLKKKDRVIKKDDQGNAYILNSLGLKTWSNRPIFEDQFTKPGMVEFDAPITAVFDLADPAQLEAFNDLQSLTFPSEAPSVQFVDLERNFYKGKYVIIVTYSKVWYLMPEPKS